jgi:hypothetical protein
MSDTISIALVAEGITDYEVLKAAVESMLDGRSLDMKLLQPEASVAFTGAGNAGALGGGWRGVYKWLLQAVERSGGQLRNDPLFHFYDILVIHLDADVAREDPANYRYSPIPELVGMLPCEVACLTDDPRPHETTSKLRQVLLSWMGEKEVPPRTTVCTPSKSTEAWVMAIFFPHDSQMIKLGWECHPDPESRLAQQPKKVRFAKKQLDYASRGIEMKNGWKRIVKRITEAKRFEDEFLAAVAEVTK